MNTERVLTYNGDHVVNVKDYQTVDLKRMAIVELRLYDGPKIVTVPVEDLVAYSNWIYPMNPMKERP